MWEWLKRALFGSAYEAVKYLFRCIVCEIEAVLSQADAKKQGWTYKPDGWRCGRCSGN